MFEKLGHRFQSEKTFHARSQDAFVKTACSILAISERPLVEYNSGAGPFPGLYKKLMSVQKTFLKNRNEHGGDHPVRSVQQEPRKRVRPIDLQRFLWSVHR